jgi:hypothetical protein
MTAVIRAITFEPWPERRDQDPRRGLKKSASALSIPWPSVPGTMPDAEGVAAMMKYNESLQKAGVLLALDGLHPPSMGARVSFADGKPRVTDGPFTEAKEVIGGYWMIQVKSREEAIEWASRCPASNNEVIEVRQVQEMADFPPDVREAAGLPEMQKRSGQTDRK